MLICVDGTLAEAQHFAEEHGISRCLVAAVVDEDAPQEPFSFLLLFGTERSHLAVVVKTNGIPFWGR